MFCTAVIGDVVASRSLGVAQRRELQQSLERLMADLNARAQSAVLSRFIVTLGDEFQGLLARPSTLPELLWVIEEVLPKVRIRVGVGHGTLSTRLKPDAAVGMDGPVFHAAREAVSFARAENQLGGVFRGFGARQDRVLNGYARILWAVRSQWTVRQREVAVRLREDEHPREIARELGITAPAVYNRARSAQWPAFQAAADGWRAMLEQFDLDHQGRAS